MLPTSILAATFASLSLFSFGTAAPVAQADEILEITLDDIILEEGPVTSASSPSQGRQIKWRRDDGEELCLQVNGGTFYSGQSIGVNYCFTENLSIYPFQQFIYNAGSTKIRVAPNSFTDTEYCIDFGSNLGANGQGLKIWECYDNLPAQQLYITDDNHIAVENGPGQCADVRGESGPEPVRPYGVQKQVQSWECSYGNPNQIFIFDETPTPPAETEGRPIRWLRDDGSEVCLQVNAPGFSSGTIGIGGCLSVGATFVQRFFYNAGSTKIRVNDTQTDAVYCVDFGANPHNGSPIKIAACDDNAPGQRLYITDDNHIAVENGPGNCLDVQAESGVLNIKPYGVLKSVQNWECTYGNTNQIFIFPDA